MLRMMRRNAKSWVVKFVFGVIIVVFSFWGVGSMKAKQMTVAATVNGKSIERKTLENSFRDLWRRYQEQEQGKFNPDEARSLQIKQEALNGLVDRLLLTDQAALLGLTVGEDELRQRIASLPAFQQDGRFDQEAYRRALSYNRMTPAQFEAGFQEDILLEKVRIVVGDGAKILPEEVDILLHQQREEIAVDLLEVAPADYQSSVVVDDAGLEKFFNEKQESYRVPEQRKIAALVIDRAKLLKNIVVSDTQISENYQKNLEKFKVKEQLHARHILIMVAEDGTPEEVEKAKAEIEAVLVEVKAGGDFAELAKTHSQGPSSTKGGDLGWFGRGAMVKPFEDAVFALESGSVSEPVRTQFGFHLIKCEEYKAAQTKKLVEVKTDIKKSLRSKAFPDALKKSFEEITVALAEADQNAFVEQARKLGYLVVETGYFRQKGGLVPDIGKDQVLIDETFKTEVGKTAKVLNPSRNSYYFMVTEKKESYLPELAEARKAVEKAYRLKLAKVEVKKISEKVASALKEGQSFDEVAAGIDTKLIDSGFFVRGRGAIPKLGNDLQLSRRLFALTIGETTAALQYRDSFFFARLQERRLELGDDGEQQKEDILQRLIQYKRYRMMNEFVQALRQDAEIKVMAGVLD